MTNANRNRRDERIALWLSLISLVAITWISVVLAQFTR